jgi:hypothetical protein
MISLLCESPIDDHHTYANDYIITTFKGIDTSGYN